ncbi:H-NS family nucleoid-associated regulatory protein [Bradyrhizobium erythrophlei]|jgi:DNA-binding protein H-NS|uniref:DNA-binding protein H-NS n=1 Tax=Bradyrhizobium erythrophlei TaxID=1437360 RepID=A0A1M5KMY8_9BRAD|nr:H-NS histone family protein [Bradyrhizobium erythrophlei]SHG53543.1 DNA-binding protein H-NS [Bradyrhizobium erythrophlei]
MKRAEFEQMSVDHLWKLRAEISAILAARIGEEKKLIEERLIRLRANSRQASEIHESERRPYPRVFPKFRNPDDFSQTWAGRGKQPRWLTAQLKSGRRVDEFRI